MRSEPVLVTGSTGYVGGRLVPQLLASGYRVRAVGRSLQKMQSRPWASDPGIEMARADMLDYEALLRAARGCWAAFYLVHSMNPRHKDFAEADRKAAGNMALAATRAGLERIVYLGGLGKESPDLSKHLRSRTEVARILQSGRVPTTFLRPDGRYLPSTSRIVCRSSRIRSHRMLFVFLFCSRCRRGKDCCLK